MKKLLIISVNIIILCTIFIFIDYKLKKNEYDAQYKIYVDCAKQHSDYNSTGNIEPYNFKYDLSLTHFKNFYENEHNSFLDERRIFPTMDIPTGKNNAIIFFGCSFAEGAFLNFDKTLEYKLAELSGERVYNRGFAGFGLGQMVWMTKQSEFYKDIKEPVNYVLYIYINDHLRRIYEDKYGHINYYLSYEEKDGKLIEKNPITLPLQRFYVVANFYRAFMFSKFHLNAKNDDKNFDLVKLHFEEARKELQKRYPNVKFIIIKHPYSLSTTQIGGNYSLAYNYITPRWKELEDEGFIIIDLLKDFPGTNFESEEYTVPNGHPNSKAWDIVVKKLIKYII